MSAVLKPFQQVGALFLAQRTRALLADEPGVGKTGQLIAAANFARVDHLGIVAPEIGLQHWERELNKWNFQGSRADIYGWGEAHEVRDSLLSRVGGSRLWDALIPDEVHFGKNPLARRAMAVLGKHGLGWHARRVWASSGTPSPNYVNELWPLLRAFGKTKMDQEQFTAYFCELDWRGKVIGNRADHIDELRAILKEFSLRRLKRDVLPELGPMVAEEWYVRPDTRWVGPDFAMRAMNSDVDTRARLEAMKGDDDAIVAFLSGRDEKFSTLRRFNALLKAPAVFDTVKFELENDLLEKVVIFGHHTEALQRLHQEFRAIGIASTCITGDETPAEISRRDLRIESWKREGQVMLASIGVASTVLDFTAAHEGIMLEMGWVPGDNSQAMLRMHRMGQTNPVRIRVACGTPVDEIVTGVYLRKTKALDEVWG